jgi:hypothetical protein
MDSRPAFSDLIRRRSIQIPCGFTRGIVFGILGFSDLPQVFIATDIKGASRDGGRPEDCFPKCPAGQQLGVLGPGTDHLGRPLLVAAV